MPSIARSGWDTATPVFRRVLSSLLVPDASEEQLCWLDELMRVSASPTMAVQLRREWATDNVTGLPGRVQVPALVVHARGDQVVPFDEARRLASGIPGAGLVPLPSHSHVALADEPAWPVFLTALRSFLGSTAPAVRPRQP